MKAGKGYTFDPCHGCGEVPTHYRGRPKNGVCENCRHQLDLAKKVAKEAIAAGGEVKPFAFPTQSHWLPYLPEHAKDFGGRPIQHAFWEAVIAATSMSTESGRGVMLISEKKHHRSGFSPGGPADYRLVNAGLAAKLDALYKAIDEGLASAYSEGKQRGSNLLAQLASGDMTVNDFNDRSLDSN